MNKARDVGLEQSTRGMNKIQYGNRQGYSCGETQDNVTTPLPSLPSISPALIPFKTASVYLVFGGRGDIEQYFNGLL